MFGMDHLQALEQKSIYILREVKARFKNPAIMWSTGKDSTAALWLCRKAFVGTIPFPVIHIDTGCKFPEIYAFRDRMVKEWGLELVVGKNEAALAKGVNPASGKFQCCNLLKTETLKRVIVENGFDAVIVSIRCDEHGIRAKERVFSPRDSRSLWNYKDQPPELWDVYLNDPQKNSHTRVHPILHWTELETWMYVRQEGIPVNPLYFARKGKRYRSLGCIPCTGTVTSHAATLDAILDELKTTGISERSGRAQDKENEYTMQKLRSLGYL
jgi:sulfate adenylyltransferase subunit 2